MHVLFLPKTAVSRGWALNIGLFIAIFILGLGIAAIAIFLARSIILPRRVEALQSLLKQNKTQAVIKSARWTASTPASAALTVVAAPTMTTDKAAVKLDPDAFR